METKNKNKKGKAKGRTTAAIAGTVCSAVMLLSGSAMLAGCDNNTTPTVKNGLSAYEIAVKYGYEGTEEQWIYDLQHQALQGEQGPRGDDGRSAYEIAVDQGFNGTIAEWLASLQGGGVAGPAGKSAYELYVDNFEPADPTDPTDVPMTYLEWQQSLVGAAGPDGKSAYDIYVESLNLDPTDPVPTVQDFLNFLKGANGNDGKSAYELYVDSVPANETPLTQEEWLEYLKGADGAEGPEGKSAYELYVESLNLDPTDPVPTLQDFFEALKGDQGDQGEEGKSAYDLWVESLNLDPSDPVPTVQDFLDSLKAPTIVSLRYVEDNTGAYIETTFSNNTTQKIYLNRVVTSNQDLVDAIEDDTITAITLSGNIALDQDVNIEGKTITVEDGTLTLSGDVTLTNATIDLTDGNANLVLDDADLVVASGSSITISGDDPSTTNITIDNNSSVVVAQDAELVITNATITSDITLQADPSASVDISTCTVDGNFTIATAPVNLNNQMNGGSKLSSPMLLGNEDPAPQKAATPQIILNDVTFNGNVTINLNIDVVFDSCYLPDTTKTITLTKGNLIIKGDSFDLLDYLTVAQTGDALVSLYADTASSLIAARDYVNDYKAIYLDADITSTTIELNDSITINGQDHKLKANISGSGDIVFNDIWTTNITVAKNLTAAQEEFIPNGFTGSIIFNGGKLDTDRPGTSDSAAAFYSSRNNATFEFHDMAITANITKGIKIYNAKAVVIDNCQFDATNLQIIENEINSNIQSLSLVDIQIGTGTLPTNVTITGCYFKGAPQGSTAVPTFISANGVLADSDTGAAIKIKAENGVSFGTVTITGNTFEDNYRDVLLGTGPYANQLQMAADAASNGRSGDGLVNNVITAWVIENNTTTLSAQTVADRGVATLSYIGGPSPFNKYTTKVGKVGQIVEGCAIWVICDAFEKVNGTWYYKEGGKLYSVAVEDGQAILTEFVNS